MSGAGTATACRSITPIGTTHHWPLTSIGVARVADVRAPSRSGGHVPCVCAGMLNQARSLCLGTGRRLIRPFRSCCGLLFTLLIAGCGQESANVPVGMTAAIADPPPVVLVPGAEASTTLTTAGGEVPWAATPRHLLDPATFERLALPLTLGVSGGEPLVPIDIIRGLPGQDFYGAMIASLEERVGGPCVIPGATAPHTRRALFPWDWRLDLSPAAARLDRLIERLRTARGASDLRVDLVTHSAGGIVVRHFIRCGSRDVLGEAPERVEVDFAGASMVRRAALIAVPNDVTLFGLRLMMRGHEVGRVKLRPELVEQRLSLCLQSAPWPTFDGPLAISRSAPRPPPPPPGAVRRSSG